MLMDEFMRSGSRCVNYNGQQVCLFEDIEVPEECRLLLTFESSASEWRQGLYIGDMYRKGGLRLSVADTTAPGLFLWMDTSPREVLIKVRAPGKHIQFHNIW